VVKVFTLVLPSLVSKSQPSSDWRICSESELTSPRGMLPCLLKYWVPTVRMTVDQLTLRSPLTPAECTQRMHAHTRQSLLLIGPVGFLLLINGAASMDVTLLGSWMLDGVSLGFWFGGVAFFLYRALRQRASKKS
jgi:hypothetical protein